MGIITKKCSSVCETHYLKLVCRSVFFLAATVLYAVCRIVGQGELLEAEGFNSFVYVLLGLVWVAYVTDMISRFFPSRLESIGSGKQFAKNYMPTGKTEPRLYSWKGTLAVVLSWVALNGAIGALYLTGVIDASVLVLVSLAYGVCDMICILFFCPFQTWMMKNRCCATCRIYNWDFAMMFTPLAFLLLEPRFFVYSWSLLGIALVLLVRWEITRFTHPERFSRRTNACLSCASCNEKLCAHKPQLRSFIKKNKDRFKED